MLIFNCIDLYRVVSVKNDSHAYTLDSWDFVQHERRGKPMSQCALCLRAVPGGVVFRLFARPGLFVVSFGSLFPLSGFGVQIVDRAAAVFSFCAVCC